MGELAARVALWVGVLHILIGLICRYLVGLPAFGSLAALFGMILAMLGFIATDPQYTRGAMRGVVGLALLGALSTLHVLPQAYRLLRGEPTADSATSILARGTMLLLCSALLGVCIASFVTAHRKRALEGGAKLK